MEQYLFKGLRIETKTWIEGSLISFAGASSEKAIIPSNSKVFMPTEKNILCAADCYAVVPATVGQYTGRQVSGKKLFAGDIISARGARLLVDRDSDFHDFWTYYYTKAGEKCRLAALSELADWEIGSIVGNIHVPVSSGIKNTNKGVSVL